MAEPDMSKYEGHPIGTSGSGAEAEGHYGEAPAEAAADAPAAAGAGGRARAVLEAVQPHVEWARREAAERSAYLAYEARRRPWQSGALALAIICALFGLIALSSEWLELHVAGEAGTRTDGHVDLSHVWACNTRERSETVPAYDCDVYSLGDAPTKLDGLASTSTATAILCVIAFFASLLALALTLLRRLDRVDALGSLAPTLGSKLGCVISHVVASFFFMLGFSVYSGGVNPIAADQTITRTITRDLVPTSVWFGAGFAFAIITWLGHAACAYIVFRTPLNEETISGSRAPPVGSGPSAAEAGGDPHVGVDDGEGLGGYASPLTDGAAAPAFTGSMDASDAAESAPAPAAAAAADPQGDDDDDADEEDHEPVGDDLAVATGGPEVEDEEGTFDVAV